MMRQFIILIFFITAIACGGPQQMQVDGVADDNIGIQGQYKYTGILKIYRASSGCMGSGGSHIFFQNKYYHIGSKSDQSFNDLTDSLFNNNDLYNSFDKDGCFNFYNLNFNGEFTQELVFQNGSQVMADVVHVSTHQVK